MALRIEPELEQSLRVSVEVALEAFGRDPGYTIDILTAGAKIIGRKHDQLEAAQAA